MVLSTQFHMVVNSQKKLVQAEQKEMLEVSMLLITQGGFYSSIVLCSSTTEIDVHELLVFITTTCSRCDIIV